MNVFNRRMNFLREIERIIARFTSFDMKLEIIWQVMHAWWIALN